MSPSFIPARSSAIFVAGTGNPYFTTDTAAALRAVEIGAEVLMKATKVDGVYDADPMTVPGAHRYERLEYADLLRDQLKVLDGAAVSLCMENDLPIVVFELNAADNIARVVAGVYLDQSFRHFLAILGKRPIHQFVEIRLIHQSDVEKGQSIAQFLCRRQVLGKIPWRQQDAIDIIRFYYIGDKAAVQNDLVHAGAPGQIHHPAQRFHLHPANLRGFAKTGLDLIKRCRMHAWRQIARVFKWRDHLSPSEGGAGCRNRVQG